MPPFHTLVIKLELEDALTSGFAFTIGVFALAPVVVVAVLGFVVNAVTTTVPESDDESAVVELFDVEEEVVAGSVVVALMEVGVVDAVMFDDGAAVGLPPLDGVMVQGVPGV